MGRKESLNANIERFVNALLELQRETAAPERRAAVLAAIAELEDRRRIEALEANSWRGVIDWLAGVDLTPANACSVFDELVEDPTTSVWRAMSTLVLG